MKLVQVPFSRDVDLRQGSDGSERIAEMTSHLSLCQDTKAVVCRARESRLSLELKAEINVSSCTYGVSRNHAQFSDHIHRR